MPRPSTVTRIGRAVRFLLLLLLVSTSTLEASEKPDGEFRTARIISRTANLIYVDAGREDGLQEGDQLEVIRDSKVFTVLHVTYLSSHRASCSLEDKLVLPNVGDTVRFTPHEIVEADAPSSSLSGESGSKKRNGQSWFRRNGIRGRVGLRYLGIQDQTQAGSDLSQPAADMKITGNRVGGSSIDMDLDVRSRRTYTTLADGTKDTDNLNRVYRMSTTWNEPHSGLGLTVGRQYSPTLSSVSIFDGFLADFARESWSAGLFTGTQPDPIDYGHSTSVREHGMYLQFHNRPGQERRWSLATGAVGSYEEGEINREFLFLQSRYAGPRLSLYLIQEVDYNRDWKAEFEESTLSATSTFFNANYRVSKSFSLRTGYDNRQRIRLYRDRVTPVTEFDDSHRQGARIGWTWRSPRHYRVSMDGRTNRGVSTADSDSYTLNLGASSFTTQNVSLDTRSTRYTNEQAEGWLHSANLGTNLGSRVRLVVGGGVREETAIIPSSPDSRLTWATLDLDFVLGRHWYLLISTERNRSELDKNNQVYTSLTYRF